MSSRILIADDDDLVRAAVQKILKMFGHEVVAVHSGTEVLATVDENFDVIILDINMPDMDGFETLQRLNRKNLEIPVLFLTGAGSLKYALEAIKLGAYDFMTKPIDDIGLFQAKIMRAVEKRTFVRREQLYRATLEQEIKDKTGELASKNELLEKYSMHLEKATVQIMSSMQTAMEEKDEYTAGHTMRVTELATMLGLAVNLSDEDQNTLRQAAQFHDVGKLVIDLSCIQKPGKLSDEEWGLIKRHPAVGDSIMEPLAFMDRERSIIRHHHERLDGRGYPDGIGGDEIDLMTRIITIADSYDAMTSRRNYRTNMTTDEALRELRRCSTTQFDPELVEIFAGLVLSSDPKYKGTVFFQA